MAKRKLTEHLIPRDSITEELRLIKDSETDYITPTGKIYKDYGNNLFFPKRNFINKHNNYVYCGITYPQGQRQRRVHILIAEVYIPNPNNYPIVMHLDNDKTNNVIENLKWGTISENTQQAFDDKLAKNDKNWDDSQSIHICCFDLNGNLLQKYGSISEASRQLSVSKNTIINQCRHQVKTQPRCGYWFRYLSEYELKGFVL